MGIVSLLCFKSGHNSFLARINASNFFDFRQSQQGYKIFKGGILVDMMRRFIDNVPRLAGVVELVDAPDSKSGARNGVRVRVPPPAPLAPLQSSKESWLILCNALSQTCDARLWKR
jgi:hypothetical protein